MDYQNVPQQALDIAVAASKAANAEYWACDIALGDDGKFRILECATAFAAFPYIRDWIGQYLMWLLSGERFQKPFIPMFNWEELGKINSNLLRTMRQIAFSKPNLSEDCGDQLVRRKEESYQLLPMELRAFEEWPSEVWNFQDNYQLKSKVFPNAMQLPANDSILDDNENGTTNPESEHQQFDELELLTFFSSVKGVGEQLTQTIIEDLGVAGTVNALNQNPHLLLKIKGIKEKKLESIVESWQQMVAHRASRKAS